MLRQCRADDIPYLSGAGPIPWPPFSDDLRGGRPVMPAAFPLRPPWPEPAALAPGAVPPPMDSSEAFIADAAGRYGDDESFAAARWHAARRLLADGDLGRALSPVPAPGDVSRALAAWLLTPREAFLPAADRPAAYAPHALPIGHHQTISAPYMVARMTSALNPAPGAAVLEVGTGSGYQAAMLAVLSGQVHTVEHVAPLAAEAGSVLNRLAERRPWLSRIRRRTGSGYGGWDERAPFHRIIVTCAIDHLPAALLEQTAPGGMLILPYGDAGVQRLLAFRRRESGESGFPGSGWESAEGFPGIRKAPGRWDVRDVYGDGTRVAFVPFVY